MFSSCLSLAYYVYVFLRHCCVPSQTAWMERLFACLIDTFWKRCWHVCACLIDTSWQRYWHVLQKCIQAMFRFLSLAHHVDTFRAYMPVMSPGVDVQFQHDHIDRGVAIAFGFATVSFKLCVTHFVGQSAANLLIMSTDLTWNTVFLLFTVTSPTCQYVLTYII